MSFSQLVYVLREEPMQGQQGSKWLFPMKLEARGSAICTHLWVEWKFHVGFIPKAELGEVVENCQEMVVGCHRVFITDAQF